MAPVTSHTSSIEMGPLVDNDTDHFQPFGFENMDWLRNSGLIDEGSIQQPTPSSEFLQSQSKVEPQATQHGAQEQGQLMSSTDFDQVCTADAKASVEDNQVRNDDNSAERSVMNVDQAQCQELNEILKAIGGINLHSTTHYQALVNQLQDNRSYFEVQFGDLKKQMEESLPQGKSPAAMTVEGELAQEKERRRKLESDCQNQAKDIIRLKSEVQRLLGVCHQYFFAQQPPVQGAPIQQFQTQQLQAQNRRVQLLHAQQLEAQKFHTQAQQLSAQQFQAHQPQVLQPQVLQPPMESTQHLYKHLMNYCQPAPFPPGLNGLENSFEQHPGLKEIQPGPTSVPTPTDFQFGFSTNGVFEGSKGVGRPVSQKRGRPDSNAAQQEGKQEKRVRKAPVTLDFKLP
ncbi:hypothetical protein GE21DRAFT_8900 [Neurospora crassa]|uniref:Uncharacterized protein n=1 Tax=Neurospora crassa (strain ATCC 24698 / 74-OR23-1A / CBS 708.71 / DSM 1257 / FGSC 987) TaxID=367110 RepID=Q7S5V2_NEUCR|nr:hypothetical protein NCU05614 [Neurospora crassa OR74A]EAA30904.3 hypothetical protein NCU05614 [Neurospora crassa OR74A]KHE78326.1 hypothetical protein GE21DRAFT_8900 [Neurospora crassa]|eukprot:XP_960140.3 hypothetical protein NCU05614 [Neurospora crassa OR74A]